MNSRTGFSLLTILTALALLFACTGIAEEELVLPDEITMEENTFVEPGIEVVPVDFIGTDAVEDIILEDDLELIYPSDDTAPMISKEKDLNSASNAAKASIPGSLHLGRHETYTLKVKNAYFVTSDSKVATVDNNGCIKALKRGTAKIDVFRGKRLLGSCNVKVLSAPKKVTLSKGKLVMKAGRTFKLTAKLPNNTASNKLSWTSSNNRIATVSQNGVVRGLKRGTATITVTTYNKRQASCAVTVMSDSEYQGVPVYDLSGLTFYKRRKKLGDQDIAIYNHVMFGFSRGLMYVNNMEYPIENGHGNNCMFGKELHGNYPYLYCGSWTRDHCAVYVNQITENGATLIKTIDFPTLSGYLNCCVDEPNQRIYILLTTSLRTWEGDVDFIVSDFEGNILSRKTIDKVPVIQGMVLRKGKIYVLSGYGNKKYPNYLSVYNISGELISKASEKGIITGENEGIDFDGNHLVICNRTLIYRQ